MMRFDFCCRCGIEYSVFSGRQTCRCGVVHYLGISEQQYKESRQSRVAIVQRSAWGMLHSYSAVNTTKWNPAVARQWYETEWMLMVPGCGECRQHWAELTEEYPPDFSSPKAFFEWGWARHDDVSRLHSKRPRITLEEAYAIYWPSAALS